ncbi:anaphase-promoting complex subunit 2 [Lasallia pustulata]|uniref:Anaphase-promoting complex subunit 2 n=1 Tax=Lasallia pustulata TaxID=136370 RepID=A0A1W5D9X1_9LECA|nr:anaphase-promoting complex subunit 2 [Lasallia pustulata]
MAEFLTNLVNSIFTPGPTPSLVVATNASFAALQLVLLLLLMATYSIHFLILSILSAGLWWAINWFVAEIQAGNTEEEDAKRLRDARRDRNEKGAEDSGTETEAAKEKGRRTSEKQDMEGGNRPEKAEGVLRKRRSFGDVSGDLSTDSEWDKVSNEGEEDA